MNRPNEQTELFFSLSWALSAFAWDILSSFPDTFDRNTVYQSARAAVTEYHKPGGLHNKIIFLQFWRPEV